MDVETITLQPDLLRQVRRIVAKEQETVEDFVKEAIRERLERLEDEKLEAEAQAFKHLHPQLVERYLGQFVAVHDGQVVDADADFESIFLRVQKRLGDLPVLIRLVSTEPDLELRTSSPRLEWNKE